MLSRPLCCGTIPEDASENSTFRAGIGLESFFAERWYPRSRIRAPEYPGERMRRPAGVVEPKHALECPI